MNMLWLKQIKHSEIYLIILLMLSGGFLRFFRLSETLQFLGDQGRDALIVKRLLIEHDPVFIGPVTSVGNMYLGPAYYYFMLPFFALTYPSPMGPVYAIALLGTLTIPLLFAVGKELVGRRTALFATILYTFGWVFIAQSRFSWNPNPAPFVSLLMIWATYRAWKRQSAYWILVSLFFSMLIQLHYLTLLALPAAGIFWLLSLREILLHKNSHLKTFLLHTGLAILLFLLSLTPLVLFDLKHDFLNAKAFYNITFGKEEQIRSQREAARIAEEVFGRMHHIIFEIVIGKLRWLNSVLIAVFACTTLWVMKKATPEEKGGKWILLTWLIVGIAGTSVYRSSIFDHYIAYLFPVTCLVLSMSLAYFYQSRWMRFLVGAFFIWFFVANFTQYDFQSASLTMQHMWRYSQHIAKYVEPSEPYSLVGINSYNDIYAMNYRYFLSTMDRAPLETEDANSAKKLVIVNETEDTAQAILDLPIYEIVIFPDKGRPEIITTQHDPKLMILRRL